MIAGRLCLLLLPLPLAGCLISPPANESCGHHLRLFLEFEAEPPAEGLRIVFEDGVRPWRAHDCTPESPWEGEPSCYDGLFEHGTSYTYHDEFGQLPPESFDLWIWEIPILRLLYSDTLTTEYERIPIDEWDPDSVECLYSEVTVTIPADDS